MVTWFSQPRSRRYSATDWLTLPPPRLRQEDFWQIITQALDLDAAVLGADTFFD
ncbi:MAG: hypothetical protein F6K31_14735 [Symploca sp. SIO2G7]|nr:hypothetical protein [Symploca sp. SIO2G7]